MARYRTTIIYIGITTLVFILAAVFLRFGPFQYLYLPVFPILLVFFLLLYLTYFLLLIRPEEKNPSKFINRFILLTGIKFLFLFIAILLYLIFNKTDIVSFLIYVLIMYAGYSISSYTAILINKKNK